MQDDVNLKVNNTRFLGTSRWCVIYQKWSVCDEDAMFHFGLFTVLELYRG